MPPRHNVPSGYAGGYASIPRRGHAPVVHEDADNRLRCSSSHRDAENCGVTRKYAKKGALVTTNGRKYLEPYGHGVVTFDDTFNVTRYAFCLATLLVSDDVGNGFPCPYLLSYRMTATEIRVLFELAKRKHKELLKDSELYTTGRVLY
ncbi:hypothetical protein RB195_024996 [Necator americanus]|uniref:Uncharacterized protein n=1 Tax=Necator americanus TaxID=51031 RepID=A0ABR1EQG2_NECAM